MKKDMGAIVSALAAGLREDALATEQIFTINVLGSFRERFSVLGPVVEVSHELDHARRAVILLVRLEVPDAGFVATHSEAYTPDIDEDWMRAADAICEWMIDQMDHCLTVEPPEPTEYP